VGFNECALVATQTLSGLTPTAKQSATLARASATHPILKSGSLPLPPHRVHRAERRSMLLDASAPHRMIHGASAVETRWRQRSQITQSQGVTQLGEGGDGHTGCSAHRRSLPPRPSCFGGRRSRLLAVVSEFRFIHPAAPSQLRKYLPAMIGCMSRTRWLRLQVAKHGRMMPPPP